MPKEPLNSPCIVSEQLSFQPFLLRIQMKLTPDMPTPLGNPPLVNFLKNLTEGEDLILPVLKLAI